VSAFSDVDSLGPQQIWAGVTARAVHGEQVTVSLLELDPGSTVPEHSHDNEQVGVLITGSLDFRIGAEARQLGPGGIWCIPARVPHAVSVGPQGAVLVEAFSPPRDDWQTLAAGEPGRGRWP
jgi:quercetin dioxygenase-like cupin family protein